MQQIGRYQIIGELGRGAMGVVYRAQDPAIGRTVAIKTIRLAEVTDPKERERLRERLFREAQSAGALSHPNIVTVYDVAEEHGLAYIAMEYVDGQTLDRVLTSPDFPDGPRMLEILRQTATALDYAHSHGIVHRDIKPANVMIEKNGTSKITDFGVAKILSQQMTQAAGIIGTPNYMSPEQVEGAPLDGRADQFSLGVIAYEALTGEKPFVGDPLPTLLYKIVHEEPLPPQRLNPTLGWQVETVLKKALAKDAANRYPNCAEFGKALAAACNAKKGWQPMAPGNSQNMPTIAATVPTLAAPRRAAREEPGEPPKTGRRAALVVLLLALLGAGAFAAYHFLKDRPAQSIVAENRQPAQAEPPPSPAAKPTTEPVQQEPVAQNPVKPETTSQVPKDPVEKAVTPPVPVGPDEFVTLGSNPPGAMAVIDGRPRNACRTPCTLPISPGKHTLVASLAGYRGTMRTFEVPAETSVNVVLERSTGVLLISSSPAGASITVNGQLRAEKTPAKITLPEGKYRIVVSLGNSNEEIAADVKEGVTGTVNIDFGEQK